MIKLWCNNLRKIFIKIFSIFQRIFSPFHSLEHLVVLCTLPECTLAPYSRCHYYSWWSGWWLAGTVTGTALIWTGCDLANRFLFLKTFLSLGTNGWPAGHVLHKAMRDVRNHTRSCNRRERNTYTEFWDRLTIAPGDRMTPSPICLTYGAVWGARECHPFLASGHKRLWR